MSETPNPPPAPAVVVDVDMPSWPLVRFLIRLTVDSIPLGIVIALIYAVAGLVWGASSWQLITRLC
jgi:hypothetical protein